MTKTSTKRAESSSGFHFLNLYQCCPRKFYFRYLKGWRPEKTAQPLIHGSAFHEGKATFYTTKSLKKALVVAKQVIIDAKDELASDGVFNEIMNRIPILLTKWVEEFGYSDLEAYAIVEVEKEYVVPLSDTGYSLTIRPDTILRSKLEDYILVMETKTSGFSHRITGEAVYHGDQATSYLFGTRKMGLKTYAVQPDIAYWNSKTMDTNNIKFVRTDLVMRSERECLQFERSVGQIMHDISQRALAYKQGRDPWTLFPRNSAYCLSFSTLCDAAHFCQQDCERKGMRVPDGFKKVRGVRKLGGYVEDGLSLNNGG